MRALIWITGLAMVAVAMTVGSLQAAAQSGGGTNSGGATGSASSSSATGSTSSGSATGSTSSGATGSEGADSASAPGSRSPVTLLTIDGPIGPATADYVVRGMHRAKAGRSQLVILEMDTPGGLDTAMRQIIKSILGSPVPVAAYVAPSGARAASAGTYILYASHVAAMAPGTNLGAATPVAIGIGGDSGGDEETGSERESGKAPGKAGNKDTPKEGDAAKGKDATREKNGSPFPFGRGRGSRDTMTAKQVNDAAAYIRSLADLRGRNAEWAERAVRESVSLSAQEAAAMKVIDLVADDRRSLLARLDGRSIEVRGAQRKLATAGAATVAYEPDWRTRLLGILTNPSVALILMMIGVYGLLFEFSSPGMVAPGVIGGISLLLAMFAFQWLPVNYAGVALILLGIAFMVAEIFLPSFGVIGIGGIVAFAIGTIMLIDTDVPGFGVPWSALLAVVVASALFMGLVLGFAWRARRRPVVSGRAELIGATGPVVEVTEDEAWAHVHGELWRVRSRHPLAAGELVEVTGVDGLTLNVIHRAKNRQGA